MPSKRLTMFCFAVETARSLAVPRSPTMVGSIPKSSNNATICSFPDNTAK